MLEIPVYLLVLGFAGKGINWVNQALRLAVTVRDKEVKIYPVFWFPPVVSMIVLLIYYASIGEPVGVVSYAFSFIAYGVNIYVTVKKHGRLPWVL